MKAKIAAFFLSVSTLTISLFSAIFIGFPALDNERIYVRYGLIETSISVEALKTYADTGKIDWELFPYLGFLSSEYQAKVREFLQMQFPMDSLQMSQSLNEPMGQMLLINMGELIQVKDKENGATAIKYALLEASKSDEDFTVFDVLDNLPGELQLNILEILKLLTRFSYLIDNTETLTNSLENATATIANSEPILDYQNLPLPQTSGHFAVSRQVLRWFDQNRHRPLDLLLYHPPLPLADKTPVIMISPGLGSTGAGWRPLAEKLASHGLAVGIIQHPGSNFQHLQAFLAGEETESFKLREFIDRPQDISFILDELEQWNRRNFNGNLDLENVGILGQSFGGYAALALAGASVNFKLLENSCQTPIDLLNPSLLLQCRALELPRQYYSLRDNRIVAAFIVDPVNSQIFGPDSLAKVKIPIFWAAGSGDILTPVVVEQVKSFTALSTDNKYFALTRGANHVDFNPKAIAQFRDLSPESLKQIVNSEINVVQSYMSSFGLAFFQVYLANNPDYKLFLQPSYAIAITEEPYTLSFINKSIPFSKNHDTIF